MRAWWLVSLLLLTGVLWTIYKASGLPLAWEIGVTLVPLGLGAMVCVAFHFLDRSRFTVRGVVGPYFAALALLFGLVLWLAYGFGGGWLHAKLALTVLLVVYHLWCGRVLGAFKAGGNARGHVFYRWMNELPVLVLFAVVVLVVVKPF